MFALSIICVGRAKAGAERDLEMRYLDRARLAGRAAGIAVDLRELPESRGRRPEDRKDEEARAILAALKDGARLLCLDERGDALTSPAFAALLGEARDTGVGAVALVIGGADGLDPSLRAKAFRSLSFGAMTWPHQLVRIMAAEQLYRAVTILSGHPYHRA